MPNPTLSVCFGIMNRFRYTHQDKEYPLFERTFPILLKACQHYKNANICMVDMDSSDADVVNWANIMGKTHNVPIYSCRAQRRSIYNIGYTKNLAAQLTAGEYLAFVDVDMIIPEGYFEEGIEILNQKKCAWFPFYQREHSPEGKLYQGTGRGNCMVRREAWRETRWAELSRYGGEDCIFCNRLIKKKWEQVRTHPDNFIHIWHPSSQEKQDADKAKIGD